MKLDVEIQKSLRAQDRVFELDVKFQTAKDLIVIFGSSGAGKSVTVQAIAGLLTPDRGRIMLNGRTLYDSGAKINLPARQRHVGYVFQDYALFPHLTVAQNVSFPVQHTLWNKPKKIAAQEGEEFLSKFDLANLSSSYPRQISGGQRQRVALARALICKPDILLLDEPFAALDPMLRDRMRRELLEIQARFSVPMVIITHDPADVELFAETLHLFEAGRVIRSVELGDHALSDARMGQVRQVLGSLS